MGNPAHTATQGVNLRIQGPKHPPIGPNTPTTYPASHAAKHAREDEADDGTTPRDLAALTPRCAAGPYRWSMGNPAHTATQGVNLRIQGPKHPPIGPNTPPIPRAMPPSTRAGTRPPLATSPTAH